MKKMVKLLSVIMLVAMCFSLMSVCASAAPVVVAPGSSSSSSSSGKVFSYGTDPFTQAALENGTVLEDNIVSEPDGRVKSDGRDNSVFVQNVETSVSDAVWDLVKQYAGDVNINNDSNPYYFVWLMNKFVNGEIDYSNPNGELETARALFAEFVDEAAKNLATVAAANQVLDEDPAMKQAVEAVADENVQATVLQEALADEAEQKIEEATKEIVSDINNADKATASKAASKNSKALCVKSAVYSSENSSLKLNKTAVELHNVIVANGEITVNDTQTLTTAYSGDIVFDFKNCTINHSGTTPLVQVNGGLFKFKNGIINGPFITVSGGNVVLDNMKINVPNVAANAVKVEGGYVDMVRSNYFTSASTSDAVIYANGNSIVVFDGYINAPASSGIYIDNGATVYKNGGDILYDQPATDIYAGTGVIVNNGSFIFNGGNITGTMSGGAGGAGAAILATPSSDVSVSINGGSTGCILSAYNAAIYVIAGDGSNPSPAKVAVCDMTYLKDASGFKSDVSESLNVATVDGVGYTTLNDAVNSEAAKNGSVVQIINDADVKNQVTVSSGTVVINGNGHKIYNSSSLNPLISITGGSALIEDLTIDNKDISGANAIDVDAGSVTLNNITVDNCSAKALNVTGGDVTVDGFSAEESGAGTIAIGVDGTSGSVTVYDMYTNSEKAVKLESGNSIPVKIYQSKSRVDSSFQTLADFKADTTVSDITKCVAGGSSEALNGGYYYISAREVTLEILSGGSSDGSYLLYEKGAKDQVLQLQGSDAISEITAIGADGSPVSLNFKPSSDYKTVTLTDANLANLPAGEYTVSIKFANSGAIKVPLYVSPSTKQTAKESTTDLYLTTYDTDKAIWKYDAQSQKNGWIKVSETDLPERVGLGPNRDSVIWISNTCYDDAPVDGKRTINLLHDDLDHLGNGVNYVWLDYGTYWVPVKFEVYNAAASITPTTTDWNKIDGDKVFTVWPDVLTVKLNGQSLNSDKEYTYKDGKLTLKSSFLKTLENGNYQMEVSTSKGGVFVDMTIGEVLRPKDIDYHVYGGNKAITFVGSNTIDFDKGIWIGKQNPVQIPKEYITINGDKSFTLSAAYLNRLTTLGTYYISAYVGDQYCTTTFRIISASQAKYNPSTGDNSNIGMWVVILVLAAVVIIVILIPTLKKKTTVESAPKGKKKE